MTTPDQVPEAAQEQVRQAIDTALNAPHQAQGLLGNIPNIDVGDAKDKIVGVLDTVLEAIDEILKYRWAIPDKYEKPLESLSAALNKVKGWLT